MVQYNFPAIGTSWQIDIRSAVSPEGETALLALIKNRIDIFDKAYSRFCEDSIVTKMSQEIGEYILPDDSKKIMDLYYELYLETDGLFTPLVGNILSDAGYDAKYSLQQKKELETPLLWEQAIEYLPNNILKIKKPVLLDFGAGGKGYLIDLVSEVIESQGVTDYCIDAGGDILNKGKNIRVGLENPENKKEAIGVYDLQNQSICGSAGNRRKWGEFTHIINPATLSSPKNILAVWILAKKTLLADSLATAIFFIKPSQLLKKYDFEYLIEYADHSIEKSQNFQAEIFTK